MSQDEINLVYEYLHKNYEYIKGDLIRKIDCNKSGKKKGEVLGSVFTSPSRAVLRATIVIDGIRFSKPLCNFIFLFHNQKFPEYIDHKNGNPMDCSINNIIEISKRHIETKKEGFKGYETIETSRGIRYRVSITTKFDGKKRKIHLGSYENTEKAIEVYKSAKLFLLEGLNETQIKQELIKLFPDIRIKPKINKNLLPGVNKSKNHFTSSICIKGSVTYLGSFKTAQEAHEAYMKAKLESSYEAS